MESEMSYKLFFLRRRAQNEMPKYFSKELS